MFKMAPKYSAEVLSSVSTCEKAASANLCVSYSAIGCEFNVHESTVYSI